MAKAHVETNHRRAGLGRGWQGPVIGTPQVVATPDNDRAPLELKHAGVELGDAYPAPIIDRIAAHERALRAIRSCATLEKNGFSLTASRISLSSSHR